MINLFATNAEITQNIVESLRDKRSILIELIPATNCYRLFWCGDASSLYDKCDNMQHWANKLTKLTKMSLKLTRICKTKAGTLVKIEQSIKTTTFINKNNNLTIFD